jgi:hypothetical protein
MGKIFRYFLIILNETAISILEEGKGGKGDGFSRV